MPRSNTREKIQEYLGQRNVEGEPPTVREIAAAVGLKSPSSVQKHLKALEREGIITQGGRGRSRSWRLASLANVEPSIPVIGLIEAGEPVPLGGEPETPLSIPPSVFGRAGTVVAYRVSDDALRERAILRGDFIVVSRDVEPTVAPDGVGALLAWRQKRTGAEPNVNGDNAAPSADEVLGSPIAVIRLPETTLG